jgi:hypothetical protein
MKKVFDYLDVINIFVLMIFFMIGNEYNVIISFVSVIIIGFIQYIKLITKERESDIIK